MRRMAMAFDPKVWPAVQDLMEQVQCVDSWPFPLRSANGVRFFQQNPRLSGLLMVTAEDLDPLEPWKSLLGEAMAARLQQDLASHRGVVYTVARSGQGFLFVVAGRDLAGLRAVLPFLKKGMPSGTGRFAAA